MSVTGHRAGWTCGRPSPDYRALLISAALGIRKASIHYHYASKTELGIAVLERYTARFDAGLKKIAMDPAASSKEMLDFYFKPYLQFARTPDQVCLCGALAGEVLALPAEMRKGVDRFFVAHQQWLVAILKRGVARGEFSLAAPPMKTARLFFGGLQGALLVKRTTGDQAQLRDVIEAIRAQLDA
jgi:TetR/AcrR family transcriptional regulator, transcriptional repressor for nem operon